MGRKKIHFSGKPDDLRAIVRDFLSQGKNWQDFVNAGYGSRATWFRYSRDLKHLAKEASQLYQAGQRPPKGDTMPKITKMAAVREAIAKNITDNAAIASYLDDTYGLKMTLQYVSVYKSIIKNKKTPAETPEPVEIPAIDAPETCLAVMANVLECVARVPADALICLVRNVNRLGENGLVNLIQKAAA